MQRGHPFAAGLDTELPGLRDFLFILMPLVPAHCLAHPGCSQQMLLHGKIGEGMMGPAGARGLLALPHLRPGLPTNSSGAF